MGGSVSSMAAAAGCSTGVDDLFHNFCQSSDRTNEIMANQNPMKKQMWELKRLFLDIQLSTHVDVIQSSINQLNHYLKNPSSDAYHQDFVETAKGLQKSLERVLQRLVKEEAIGDAYLDVLKNHTVDVGLFLTQVADIQVMLIGGFAALSSYYDSTGRTKDERDYIKEYFKELFQKFEEKVLMILQEMPNEESKDNVEKEMQFIMEKSLRKKSNEEVADQLYLYLSEKYDNKQWIVVTYNNEEHSLLNFDYKVILNGDVKQHVAAMSFKHRPFSESEISKYQNTTELKIKEYFDDESDFPIENNASMITEDLRDSKGLVLDSLLLVVNGDLKVKAHQKIPFVFKKHGIYSCLVTPGRTVHFMIQSMLNTSLVIERTESRQLIVSTAHGGLDQLWHLDEKGVLRSSVDDYFISSAGYHYEDITVELCSDEKEVQGWTFEGDLITNSKRHRNEDKVCLDVFANGKESGTRLCEYECHGGLNQQWKIIRKLV